MFLELSPGNTESEIVDKGRTTVVGVSQIQKKDKGSRLLEKSVQGWGQILRSPTITR